MNKPLILSKSKNFSSSKLRKTIFLYSAVMFLLFGAVLSLAIILSVYSRLKIAEENNVYHASEIRAMVIDEWVRNAKNLASQITSRTRIREELEKYNEERISLNQLRSFTEPKLRDAMALSREILGITRLDGKGKKVAECGVKLLPSMSLGHITGDFVSVSDPIRENNHPAMIVVSAPIINRSNGYIGTDLVLVSLKGLEKILFNYTGLGKQSNIILAYASGDNVFPLFEEATFFNLHGSNDFKPLLKKAINGSRGMGDNMPDYVAAYHDLTEADWGLLIIQHKNELYNSLNERLFFIGCTAFIIYLGALLGFSFLTKPLADKILLHNDELEEKIREKTIHLQDAMDQIKTLKGIVPICATCKKIRDDQGYWNQLEVFIEKNSEASFSHGICQECSDKIYKDEVWYQEMKQEKNGD